MYLVAGAAFVADYTSPRLFALPRSHVLFGSSCAGFSSLPLRGAVREYPPGSPAMAPHEPPDLLESDVQALPDTLPPYGTQTTSEQEQLRGLVRQSSCLDGRALPGKLF